MPSVLKKRGKKSGGRRAVWWFVEFLLSGVVIWVLFSLAGRVLPKVAVKLLSDFTNTQIEVGSISFRYDGSVFIRGLLVRPHKQVSYDNSILKAETVRVHFRLSSIFALRPRLKEVYVDDFLLRAQYNSDNGEWNLAALKIPKARVGGRLPLVWLENGEVEYSKVVDGRVRVIARSPVSVGLRPAPKILGGYSFDISGASRQDFGKSAVFGSWQPGRLVVGGRISSDDVPGFARSWTIKTLDVELHYDKDKSFELMGRLKGFTVFPSEARRAFSFDTESIAEKLPFVHALQKFFERYNPSGRIDIDLLASGNIERPNESTLSGVVNCTDVAVCDAKFAYTVEHITGQIDLTEQSAILKGLVGRHGEVALEIGGWATDFGPNWKYELQITSANMVLDKELYDALDANAQKFWSDFSPSGVVAINYSRARQSATDTKGALAVELLGVDGKYAGFGYPLKGARGSLVFSVGVIELSNVISEWGGRKITINGMVGMGGEGLPMYALSIKGENIPLDSTLAEALPAAQKEFYEQFETKGQFDTSITVSSEAGQEVIGYTAEVFPKGSSIRANVLPILINDVTGRVIFSPDVVNVEELNGRYGTGEVKLTGQVWPAKKARELGYCLSMLAENIELSEELGATLPGPMSELLAEFRPRGKVNLKAEMNNGSRADCSENQLIIECLGDEIDCNFLPYPLRDISGTIAIRRSQIELRNMTARAIHRIAGEQTESMMKMRGMLAWGEGMTEEEGVQIKAGEVSFSGENVRFKGKNLSKVDTVLMYDARRRQWLSRYFVADFYDGKMIGKLQLKGEEETGLGYILEASVAGADLEKFLSDTPNREPQGEEHYSTGSISGSLSVLGSVANDSIEIGRCRLKIIDMEIGKLSPLAKLLQVLNLTEPSDYAFDQMVVDAYIQDDRVFFRELDLSGKSLAFDGSGTLDLKSDDISLTLTARGRRLAASKPSFWQSLTEGLGRAVVRVEVRGKADNPQVTTKTLPVIKETLEIFGTPKGG